MKQENKKILITSVHMDIGGIETVLIEFLKYLCSQNYEIDLILLKKNGENLNKIPESVNVYCVEDYISNKLIGNIVKKNNKISKICRRLFYTKNLAKKSIPNKKYDVSISFSGYHLFMDLIAGYANAKKKYIWIHTDFALKINNEKSFQKDFYKEKYKYELFDKMIYVSRSCMEAFVKLFPEYKNKSDYVWNFIKDKDVKLKSKEKLLSDGYNIILVGRIVSQKRFDRLAPINDYLIKNGKHPNIYIIGDGPLKESVMEATKKFDNIHLLGVKTNVYDYMREADLLLSTSNYEGLSTVLIEGLICNCPFVGPDVTGVSDVALLIAPKNSSILTKNTNKALAQGVIDAMNGKINKSFKFDLNIMNEKTKKKINELL